MIPINVSARFRMDGEIIPENFDWQGGTFPVVSTGRHWIDGKNYHILVMVPGDDVFELVFVPGEMQWYLGNLGNFRNTA
jgi:hypothetical protein